MKDAHHASHHDIGTFIVSSRRGTKTGTRHHIDGVVLGRYVNDVGTVI